MDDIDRIENITTQEFRELYGITEKKIDLTKDSKHKIKKEIIDLNSEPHIEEDSLTVSHALMIMARRSSRMREIREDPELRMMLSKKD